jgi:transaldolase
LKPNRQLHDLGQSLWLDHIACPLFDNGTLARYIAEDSITGLTSNASIFDAAIGGGAAYDAAIHAKTLASLSGEALFTELALEDLRRAADLFGPVFDATDQTDGRISMDISPPLASTRWQKLAACSARHAVGQCSRCARHHRNNSREDLECVRRPRRSRSGVPVHVESLVGFSA